MTSAWRRLLVPFALSLVGHGLLLYIIGLVPRQVERARPALRDESPLRIRLSLDGPRRPAPKPILPAGEWLDVQPVLVLPSTPLEVTPGPSSAPTLSSGGNENGPGPGQGVAVRPSGSRVVVVPKQARRVVFLLDRSGSMGLSDALDRAKTELTVALEALAPETSFQILAYNSSAWPLVNSPSGLLASSRENVARVQQQLDALTASGVTRHVEAMRTALLLEPDLVILLTDADDLSPGDVHLMTRTNHGRATIDVVELSRDPLPRPDGGLAALAALNQGQHRRVVLGRETSSR